MTTNISVPLSPTVLTAIQVAASASGRTVAEEAAEALEEKFAGVGQARSVDLAEAKQRLSRHFGSIDMGSPIGIENEAIDADLAREYGSTHEAP